MRRRQMDPAEAAQSSTLLRAWKQRVADKAAGDELADERWYAHIRRIARPVPPPACDTCDDTGAVIDECTLARRCRGRVCEADDKRSDQDWTHTYLRACRCEAGRQWERALAEAADASKQPKAPAKSDKGTSYGFRKALS